MLFRSLPASFPPMPSPATSDRRAASYLARLREWRRQDRTSLLLRSGSTRVSPSYSTLAAASPSGRCSDDKRPNALSTRAIGVTISRTTYSRPLPEPSVRANVPCSAEQMSHARRSQVTTLQPGLAWENDGVNVFGCARLVAGIGFLRLPASSTSGVTGVLTYLRKPGGA